jgi:hypothetical protein
MQTRLCVTVAILCVIGALTMLGRQYALASEGPPLPQRRTGIHVPVVAAVCLTRGFSALTPPLHVRSTPLPEGHEVVFMEPARSQEREGKELARVSFTQGRASFRTVSSLTAACNPELSAADLSVDQGIAAAISHLSLEARLSDEFLLSWSQSPGEISVWLTRIPTVPGGHVTVYIRKDGTRVFPGM